AGAQPASMLFSLSIGGESNAALERCLHGFYAAPAGIDQGVPCCCRRPDRIIAKLSSRTIEGFRGIGFLALGRELMGLTGRTWSDARCFMQAASRSGTRALGPCPG